MAARATGATRGAVAERSSSVGKCRRLQHLALNYTAIGDEGFLEIAKLENLQRLSIDSRNVTDAGMAHVAELKCLEHLELRATQVTDQTLAHVSNVHSLTRLDLSGSGEPGVRIGRNFTGTGYAHLAELPNLKTLWLNNADVQWSELTALKQLDTLHLMMPTLTEDDIRALQLALPNATVSATWGGKSVPGFNHDW